MSNERMPIRLGKWTSIQLERAIDVLSSLGSITNAVYPREIAEALKIIRDGYSEAVHSCPTMASRGFKSKYPILCATCASTWARSAPQKMIFHIDQDDGSVMWVAAYFGVAFILRRMGEEDTLEGAERFLDALPDGDEEHVYKLADFYSQLPDVALVPDGEKELGN